MRLNRKKEYFKALNVFFDVLSCKPMLCKCGGYLKEYHERERIDDIFDDSLKTVNFTSFLKCDTCAHGDKCNDL